MQSHLQDKIANCDAIIVMGNVIKEFLVKFLNM